MQITVIHNPTAGDRLFSAADLAAAVRAAGHDVRYQSTKAAEYPGALQDPGDAVLVAGGDGTLRRAALELRARHTPVALLPLGTANNFAECFGITADLDACLARIEAGRTRAVDLGTCVRGSRRSGFVEGAGFGVFPELIRVMDRLDEVGDGAGGAAGQLHRARRVLQHMVPLLPSFACTIEADGERLTRQLLLLQVMNTRRIGPSLLVAPAADATDGRLDVVWVEESQREALRGAVRQWVAGEAAELACTRRAVAALRVETDAPLLQVDDRAERLRVPEPIRFACDPGALTLLL